MSDVQKKKMLMNACLLNRVGEVEKLLKEAPSLLNVSLDEVSFFFCFFFCFFCFFLFFCFFFFLFFFVFLFCFFLFFVFVFVFVSSFFCLLEVVGCNIFDI